MEGHKTAAISYSHDSADYIQWVHDLTNDLRKRGVYAKAARIKNSKLGDLMEALISIEYGTGVSK